MGVAVATVAVSVAVERREPVRSSTPFRCPECGHLLAYIGPRGEALVGSRSLGLRGSVVVQVGLIPCPCRQFSLAVGS